MAQPVGVAGAPAPPKPKPAPVSVGAALQNVGAATGARPSSPGSDIQSSGANYGSGQANRFKATPQYKQIIRQVFAVQAPAQKAAIIRGLVRSSGGNPYKLPEYQAIRPQWDHLALTEQRAIQALIPKDLPAFISAKGPGLFSLAESGLKDAGATVAGLIQALPVNRSGGGGFYQSEGIGGALPPGQIAKNAAKDLVNLPAEVGPSVAIPVGEALNNHWGEALNTIVSPYVQALKDPVGALSQHPLNTYLMFAGPGHAGARALETAGRTVIRRPAKLAAPSVELTGNLTHERPNLSKSPVTRVSQKAIASQLYRKADTGALVPKSESVRARLTKIEVSRLVGQNERVRRAGHSAEVQAHASAVLKSVAGRAAHGVRTALQYNPKAALIPGAEVLSLIAQGVIRRPDTVVADLTKHIEQVAARRPALSDPVDIKTHDAYIKELQGALKDKAFIRNPAPAFKAAARYAKEYAPTEAKASALGHFREMSKEALQRRTLMAAVATHMPGARFDHELGMVRDITGSGAHTRTVPLSTREMAQFVHNETGGRQVAFVSHEARRGDSAHYVNSQQRPRVAKTGNTLFNFQHGLTNPSHEAMLEQRARMRGIVDAHRAVNRLDQQLVMLPGENGRFVPLGKGGKAWSTYADAQHALRGTSLVPIRLAQQFHPAESLHMAMKGVSMGTLEEEAARRSLDITSRLSNTSEKGQFGAIDRHAAAQLKAHENLISPNSFLRGFRGLTGQFRRVALATSFRHLPGVAQEQLIRAVAEGIGPISYLAGRAAIRRAEQISPELGRERHIQLTGGTVTGQALSLSTRQLSRHFEGTLLESPLRSFEKVMRSPGLRQLDSAWHSWMRFTLGGTKHVLEENAQIAAIGKQVIADFGGRHGVLAAALGQWGKMIDEAAHGILDETTARRMGTYVRRVYGRWTDLTPGEQSALMFSPFGMWWVNSVAWLARMPVDHPMGAAFLAGLNTGTEKQRQAMGLDMFSPGHLPLYQQGGVPVGGKLIGANYYSPFGIANDPAQTAADLFLPWQSEIYNALRGQDWKGSGITSPGNPKGHNKPAAADVGLVVLNSLLGSFVPLYQKAQTIVEGGASSYDTSTLVAPKTKEQNPGPLKGLEKAVVPFRASRPASSSSGGGGGGFFGGSSSGGSSGGGGGGGAFF